MTGLNKLGEFSGKICYCCVPDIQKILPFKSEKEIEAFVYHMIKKLGKKGGFIGTIYADYEAIKLPRKNIEACIRAYKRFRKY